MLLTWPWQLGSAAPSGELFIQSFTNTELGGFEVSTDDLRKDNWHGLTGIETRDEAALGTGHFMGRELAVTGSPRV